MQDINSVTTDIYIVSNRYDSASYKEIQCHILTYSKNDWLKRWGY